MGIFTKYLPQRSATVLADKPSWTEAVLFDEYGNQLCCTEPGDSFDGPWELQYEGILYTVKIKTDPT